MAEILFRSDHIDGVLGGLPKIAAALPLPATEGMESTAFPGMRKTQREIYRLLSNNHYKHLVEALRILETVYAAGCTFGNLLSTTGRQMFSSLLDEALVAEHFLLRGYDVATVARTDSKTPDLHVSGQGLDMAVEVYSPREWLEIEEWMSRLQQFLKYSDVPHNYAARARTRIAHRGGPTPAPAAPWEIAAMLEATKETVFDALSTDVLTALSSQQTWWTHTYDHEESRFETIVNLENMRSSASEGLKRTVVTSPPGYIGYWPAGVFAHVVRNTRNKARERQTHGSSAPMRGLLVNLMRTQVYDDLVHPAHVEEAATALDSIDPPPYGLDVISFYVRVLPAGLKAVFNVYDDSRVSKELLEAML